MDPTAVGVAGGVLDTNRERILQEAVRRGYVTPEQLAQARAQVAPQALLAHLAARLSPEQVASLRALHDDTQSGEGQRDADATLAPGTPGAAFVPQVPLPDPLGSSPELRVADLPRPGDWILKYQILRELGRGGMGAVYVAKDPLGREVALKIQLRGAKLERFKLEAEAVGKLKHPGVVGVHDHGVDGLGRHYLVMDLVPGGSLDQRLDEGPLEPQAAAQLTVELAEALAYAHGEGILHRDLKPANVLITPQGRGVLTDFGLARVVDQSQHLSKTGQPLGTPAYMPPEQAKGRAELLGPVTDVYGLGATLYCMLTGRPPFAGRTPVELIVAALGQEPDPPSAHRRGLDPALDAICLTCLEKEQEERYPDMHALVGDLQAYLAGEPLSERAQARRPGGLRGLRRWGRRHRLGLVVVAVLGVALCGVGVAFLQRAQVHQGRIASEDTAEYWIALGDAHMLEGAHSRAVRRFRKAAELAPDLALVHTRVGDAEVARGKGEAALEAYGRALELCSGQPWEEGSILLRRSGAQADTASEGADLRQALERLVGPAGSADVDAEARKAALERALERELELAVAAGELPRALEAITRVLEVELRADLLVQRASLRMRLDPPRFTEAVDDTSRALELAPQDSSALLLRADARSRQGDYDGAMADCDAVVAADGSAEAYLRRGVVSFRSQLDARSMDDFTKSIEVAADTGAVAAKARAWRVLARYFVMQGRKASERNDAEIEKALTQDPDCAQAYAVQAVLAVNRRHYGEAATAIEEALSRDPFNAVAHGARAGLLYGRRKYQSGLAACERALTLDPCWLEPLQWRARLHTAMRNYAEAIRDHTRVLQTWPVALSALMSRARLYSLQGDHQRALEDYDAAMGLRNIMPSDSARVPHGDILIKRSRVRANLEDYAGALQDLEDALARPKRSSVVHLELGKVFRALKRDEEAVTSLRRYVELNRSSKSSLKIKRCAEARELLEAMGASEEE